MMSTPNHANKDVIIEIPVQFFSHCLIFSKICMILSFLNVLHLKKVGEREHDNILSPYDMKSYRVPKKNVCHMKLKY